MSICDRLWNRWRDSNDTQPLARNLRPHEAQVAATSLCVDARAIVADPTFLLCDEPTGDLDRRSADEILDLLGLLVSERKTTLLMVTHDPRAAERASALLHLEKGVLVEGHHRREEARP